MTPLITGTYNTDFTDHVQSFVPIIGQFFALPTEVSKSIAIECACASLRLMGASEGAIAYYRELAKWTEHRAWQTSFVGAINWRRQCDLARDLNITERTARRYEKLLESLGAIARTTAANGYRGHRSGTTTPIAGISLEPSIANFGAYSLLNAEVAKGNSAHYALVITIQLTERRLMLLHTHLSDQDINDELENEYVILKEQHRPAGLRTGTIEQLSTYHTALLSLEQRLRAAVADAHNMASSDTTESIETAQEPANLHHPEKQDHHEESTVKSPNLEVPISDDTVEKHDATDERPHESRAEHTPQISVAPDNRVRRTGQESPVPLQEEIYKESCNDTGSAQPIVTSAPCPTPSAMTSQRENVISPHSFNDLVGKCHTLKNNGPLNTDVMKILANGGYRELASDDALLYLDHFSDWENAIYMILRELDIHRSAWREACHVMGDAVAAIALLVIDRNRFHPDTPITNPGGALRAFTHCARAGQLDLTRSVMSIISRERSGRQPRRTEHNDSRPAPKVAKWNQVQHIIARQFQHPSPPSQN